MLFSRLLCLKVYQSKVIKITLVFKWEFSENVKTAIIMAKNDLLHKYLYKERQKYVDSQWLPQV
ncbi:hypothetical protein CEN50_14625 [Fischerella thermalis CCMEE 5268]|uniref:Uncharacterized protein n=1 Tax=Fischerella thermalis CCMEE 5268 TaxID=2019662 RepID=A0A2N6KES9_9CYAN|nr:hypothetical protein CEN50_14625 [Fischerella thermalis CCMEE 5268]